MTSVWWNHSVVAAGASGAIFGVYGALLGYLAREREGLPRNFVSSLTKGAVVFVAWNLFYGVQQAVSHSMEVGINNAVNRGPVAGHGGILLDQAAHIGGLVSGLLFGYLAARPLELQKRQGLATGHALVLALCFGSTIGLLFRPALGSGGTDNAILSGLGAMYLRGEGVHKDVEKSVKWFKKAAEQGDLKSQKILGTMYFRGEGVETNVEDAITWFNKSGEQGDLESQKFLASIYYKGEVVEKNMEEAIKWLAKVADQGDSQIATTLASIYFKGDGVSRDVNEAIKWVQKAAELGDVKSESLLGSMYFRGEDLPQDKAQAANWYHRAANHGEKTAQTMFGLMLVQGEGVAQDKVEAWKWLTLGGNTQPNVVVTRQALEREFTTDQTLEANRRLQRFRRGNQESGAHR
jgi:TPR repeat protein